MRIYLENYYNGRVYNNCILDVDDTHIVEFIPTTDGQIQIVERHPNAQFVTIGWIRKNTLLRIILNPNDNPEKLPIGEV